MIKYREGYKYQLAETYTVQIEIRPPEDCVTEYILLGTDGNLTIMEGYAWDGPSGPTFDSKDFMRASLVHDCLFQLIREKHLDQDLWRETADKILRRICLEDGMSAFRAWYVYHGVRLFGKSASDPVNDNPVLTAP